MREEITQTLFNGFKKAGYPAKAAWQQARINFPGAERWVLMPVNEDRLATKRPKANIPLRKLRVRKQG